MVDYTNERHGGLYSTNKYELTVSLHLFWMINVCMLQRSIWSIDIPVFRKPFIVQGRRVRDRMVVGFITTYAICLSPLTLWFEYLGPLVSSTNKTDCYNITEILLKMVLNIITLTQLLSLILYYIIDWKMKYKKLYFTIRVKLRNK